MDVFLRKLRPNAVPNAAPDRYTLPSRPQVTRTYISRKRRGELEAEKDSNTTCATSQALHQQESTESDNASKSEAVLTPPSADTSVHTHASSITTDTNAENKPKPRTIDSYFLKAPTKLQPQPTTPQNSLKRSRPFDRTPIDIKGKTPTHSQTTPTLLLSSSPSPPKKQRTLTTPSGLFQQQPTTTPPCTKPPPKYEQLFLDLGQKNAGLQKCAACGMEYTIGKGEDETLHERYHKAMTSGLEWSRHGNEIVLQTYLDHDGGRIVLVGDGSSAREKKKIREIISVVDQQLSAIPLSEAEIDRSKLYLYISGKNKIYGCVVAEPVSHAYRVILDDRDELKDGMASVGVNGTITYCSTEQTPALCGISRIWVSRAQRRTGIARRLLDVVRSRFLFGCVIEKDLLAFSQPTSNGKTLAEKYCERADFLVYDVLENTGRTRDPS